MPNANYKTVSVVCIFSFHVQDISVFVKYRVSCCVHGQRDRPLPRAGRSWDVEHPPCRLLAVSLCCLPAPALAHLAPASACSTTTSIWLQSAEIPARDRDVSWISAAGVTGKQNGGEGEHRRCGRRVDIESEGMEKSQTAEEREGAVRGGQRAEEQR